MSKGASPTLVGAFVLGAVVLGIASIVVFGSGRFFKSTRTVVLYYDSNVSGLNLGSPIAFRGVKLGEVTSIRTQWEPAVDDFLIKVMGEIDPASIAYHERGGAPGGEPMQVAGGLRARLETQSLVTGQLYVNLDFYPGLVARTYGLDPDPEHTEIPTVPSNMQFFQETMRKAAATLADLPIQELVASLDSTVKGIDKLVNSEQTKAAVANLNESMEELQTLIRSLDRQVAPTAASLQKTAAAAELAFEQMSQAMRGVSGAVDVDSPLGIQLETTLTELSEMSRSVRSLSDYLSHQPNALLLGREGE